MLNLPKHRLISTFISVIVLTCGGFLWLRGHPKENVHRPPLLCKSMGEPGGVFVTWQAPDQITRLLFPQAPGQQFAIDPMAFCFWQDNLVWWASGASLHPENSPGTGLLGLVGDKGTVRWVSLSPPLYPRIKVVGLSQPPESAARPDVLRILCDTIGATQQDFVLELAPLTGRWRKVSGAELQREREKQGYLESIGGTDLRVHPPNGGKTRLITDCSQSELAEYDPKHNAVAYYNTSSTAYHEGQIAYNSETHVWSRPGPGGFDPKALTIRPRSGEIWTSVSLQDQTPSENHGLKIYAPDGRSLGWRTRLQYPVGPYIELTSRQEVIVRRLARMDTVSTKH